MESRAGIQRPVGKYKHFLERRGPPYTLLVSLGEVPNVICVGRQIWAQFREIGGCGDGGECSRVLGERHVACECYSKGGVAFGRRGAVAFLPREQKQVRDAAGQ